MLFIFLSLSEVVHIGALKLQNGREIFASKPQLLSNNENGWYYINIINSSNIDSLLKYDVSITTKSFMNPQWVCAYLNSEQIDKISQLYYISEVLPSDKIPDKSLLLDTNQKYLIYAHETFDPPPSFQRFYKNYYIADKYSPKLLEDRTILQISPYSSPQLFNRFSRGSTQQSKFKSEFDGLLLIPDLPMHKHGIRGSGQVVTIIDSGLDYRSCFFKDKDNPPPINFTNYFHRKIVRYEPFADSSDASHGHGTHVSGIVAGNADCTQCDKCNGLSDCSISLYNGHAPESKLYFIDAGYVSKPNDLDAPYDLGYVINTSRSFGCHIFSCSWGYQPKGNDYVRLMYDEIGYDNDDIIFFFGAGNSHIRFDTFAPANSKNIMAVGGTDPTEAQTNFNSPSSNIYFETIIDNELKRSICDFSLSHNLFEQKTTKDPLVNFTNQTIGENFLLIENDNECPSIQSNIASLYITNNKSLKCDVFQQVPCCFLKKASDEDFFFKIKKGEKASLLPDFVSEKNGPSYEIAYFTSLGPSINGLIKPDILAPGKDIVSAAGFTLSSGAPACSIDHGTKKKGGTSMATPAAAGATALVAQYFADGFYPSGKKTAFSNEDDSLVPKMTLLKAIITNSAGTIRRSSIFPDCSKGFGAIHIYDSLVFEDEKEKNERFGLRISNEKFTLTGIENEEFVADIILLNRQENETERKSLIITLTWLDPPTKNDTAPLYADLDLFIECPDGKIIYGNQIDGSNEEMYSTTERITVVNPDAGNYKIHVTCPKLLKPVEISPSVVVNGPFKHFDFDTNPKFIEFKKVKIDRKCNYTKTGHYCQHEVAEIQTNQKLKFSLGNRIPKYFCYYYTGGNINVTILYERGHMLLNLYVSINQVQKFGGDLIHFSAPSSSHFFYISEKSVPKNTYIYFTLVELVNANFYNTEIEITNVLPAETPTQSDVQMHSQSNSQLSNQSFSYYISQSLNQTDLPFINSLTETILSSLPTSFSSTNQKSKSTFKKIIIIVIVAILTLVVFTIIALIIYFKRAPDNQDNFDLEEPQTISVEKQQLEGLLAQPSNVL